MSNMEQAETTEVVDEITIAGRSVGLRIVALPIYEVHLDPKNQRVQFLLSLLRHEPDENKIAEQLWSLEPVRGLYRQVKQNLGLVERIIVRANGYVVEGNCRTVVYRKLYENEGDERWTKIPSRILPEDITDGEIDHLLGELHVAGKNKWTPFEKAAYIYRMYENYGYTVEELAEHLRMGKAKVNQHLWAYSLMNDHFLKDSADPKDILKWSHFEEFYKGFKKKELAQPWEDRFVKWVREEKLAEGVQVRDLPDIVADPEALKVLEEHGYEEAMLILSRDRPELTSKLFRLIDRTIDELRQPGADLWALRNGDPARIKKIQELDKAVKELADLTGISLS